MFSLFWYRFWRYPTQWEDTTSTWPSHHATWVTLSSPWSHWWYFKHVGNCLSWHSLKVWPTPAIVVSSLAYPLILVLNILKLTKSKIDLTNTFETGSKIYPANIHCFTSFTSTIIILATDVYWPFQLLLNKKIWWIVIFTLIAVVVLTTIESHSHCHFNPLFKKQYESFTSTALYLTWNELLAYGTSIRFTVRSHSLRSSWISEDSSTIPPWSYILKTPPWSKGHLRSLSFCYKWWRASKFPH